MSMFIPETAQSLTFIERNLIRLLKTGQIPAHIGFIMDGNRRHAKNLQLETAEGHSLGTEKLAKVTAWCRELGVTQLTLYCFSIENFKRPQPEVSTLMDQFRAQLVEAIEKFEDMDSLQVCVQISGRVDLLPVDIQQLLAKIVLRTSTNRKYYLNLCVAYTSREEIVNTIRSIKECVSNSIIDQNEINEATLTNALYSQGMLEPDILLRTSGEIRLSDFQLWQSSNSSFIAYVEVLWPELLIWDLFVAILCYQVELGSICEYRRRQKSSSNQIESEQCRELYRKYRNQKNTESVPYEQFIEVRAGNIENCLHYIRDKRLQAFRDLVPDDERSI